MSSSWPMNFHLFNFSNSNRGFSLLYTQCHISYINEHRYEYYLRFSLTDPHRAGFKRPDAFLLPNKQHQSTKWNIPTYTANIDYTRFFYKNVKKKQQYSLSYGLITDTFETNVWFWDVVHICTSELMHTVVYSDYTSLNIFKWQYSHTYSTFTSRNIVTFQFWCTTWRHFIRSSSSYAGRRSKLG